MGLIKILIFTGILVNTSCISAQNQDTIYLSRYGLSDFRKTIGSDGICLLFYNTSDSLFTDFEKSNPCNSDSCYISIIDSTFEGFEGMNGSLKIFQRFQNGIVNYDYFFNNQMVIIEKAQLDSSVEINLGTNSKNINLKLALSKIDEKKKYSSLNNSGKLAFIEPVNQRFFLELKQFNYWFADFFYENDSASIALCDINGNGRYTDSFDMVSVNSYNQLSVNKNPSHVNNSEVYKAKYFGIKTQFLEIKEINDKKGYLVIAKTEKRPTFFSQFDVSNIKVKTKENEVKSIRELAEGKYLCLYFWMKTCVPCIRKFPLLNELSQSNPKNYKILGVLANSDLTELLVLKNEFNLQFDQILSSEEIERIFQVSGFPTVILIDPNGYIVNTDLSIEFLKNI